MDYAATLQQLLEYYANLLIIQYNGKSKASATIKMLANLILANLVILQIRDAFDWRTAVGTQLEIIGKWVGVSRKYNGSLYWGNTFLSYPRVDQLVPNDVTDSLQYGYSDYNTYSPTEAYIVGSTEYASNWLSLTDGGSALTPVNGTLYEIKTTGSFYNKIFEWNGEEYIEISLGSVLTYENLGFVEQFLGYDDYRIVIGLKIIKNSINHTCKNIDDAIWSYFGGMTLYSDRSSSVGVTLYSDEELTQVYGEISSLTNGITITKDSGSQSFAYINSVQDDDIYVYSIGNIYTTWQPHEVTYHYPASMSEIINICNYKNILPAPTGVSISLSQIS